MALTFRCAAFLVLVAGLLTLNAPAEQTLSVSFVPGGQPGGQPGGREAVEVKPQVVRLTATIDGSGRFVFTRTKVSYEHKHWDEPTNVRFDDAPWSSLSTTPAPWADYGARLDLTKAWIVKRQGRDVVALEHTPDGFDLYVSDSPNGAADYEVTIAIPRRP